MFGLGMGEIAIILVLALILLGPQRLPDVAKQLGKGLRDFRKATEDLKSQFETELYQQETKPQRPTLVDPPGSSHAAQDGGGARVPGAGGASRAPGAGAVGVTAPLATAENVPGLDAALAEPAPIPAPGTPAGAPGSEPADASPAPDEPIAGARS